MTTVGGRIYLVLESPLDSFKNDDAWTLFGVKSPNSVIENVYHTIECDTHALMFCRSFWGSDERDLITHARMQLTTSPTTYSDSLDGAE